MRLTWILWFVSVASVLALAAAWLHARATRARELATIRLLTTLQDEIGKAVGSEDWHLTKRPLPTSQADVGNMVVWDLRGVEPVVMTATPSALLAKHGRLLARARGEGEMVRVTTSPDAGPKRHGLAAVIGDPGEPQIGLTFFRARPFSPRELGWATMFARLVRESLDSVVERRQGKLLAELVDAVDAAEGARSVAEAALELLSRAFGGLPTTLLRYDRGVFRPYALGGETPSAVRAFFDGGFPAGVGLTWEVYRVGEPIFLTEYGQHPEAAPELVEQGLRSVAVVPLKPGIGSRFILGVWCFDPRRWRSHDVELLERFRQILRLVLDQRLAEERLAALVSLERELVVTELEHIPGRLLEAAVSLVPGASSGSLLVREGPVFRFAAVHGPRVDDWPDLEFTEEHALAWYGRGEAAFRAGQPRLAVATGAGSLMGVLEGHPVVELAAERGEPLANLCLPVVDNGEVIAMLNLDALHDRHAFGDDAFEIVGTFQPLVAFVLRDAELRRRLAQTATTDSLTGLPNRRAFDEQAAHALAAAERYDTTLALLIMDMSGFKAINDAYGHRVGDRVLRDVAAALSAVPRGGDFVYRWGGDEFAALLRNVDRKEALQVARRFTEVVAGVGTYDLPVSIDVGVALYPQDGRNLGDLLEVADRRMYETKGSARDQG